ncbi:MAG: DUF4886 domain-containing protein [Paludibacteraceae bacterium]|nr:DUF4886 domain-containing protein [Paludibacteraceae bacterium]
MKCLASLLLTIRVLCIGNSFSWDAVEQELVPLCAEKGIEIEINNLYYGGCSLEQHAQFLMSDTAVYSHRVCTNHKNETGERESYIPHLQTRVIRDTLSLREALRDGEYDIISLQQASHDSGLRNSYEPWLDMLVDTVKAYQPHAKICWMQTWAYSANAKHWAFARYHNCQAEMWDSIQTCTRLVKLPIIPCGSAIQYGRGTKLGDTFCRDGYHLNYTYGRYTAACVWYEFLTGKDVRNNRYKNPEMTSKQRRLTQKAAHRAVKEAKKRP